VSRPSAPAGTANKADIHGVMGASGTGKSSYIKRELLKKYKRLIVWSPLEKTDQYAQFCGGTVTSKITELVALVKAKTKAIVYVPSGSGTDVKKQFDLFCRVVWELENTTVLVEELSHVTMPSWAPPAWKKLSTGGRHQGLTIIGVSQRPANIDKDFLGNCTEIRCYRMNYENDAVVMAKSLRLEAAFEAGEGGQAVKVKPEARVMDLPDFHYFHKNRTEKYYRGVNKAL
jgi:hypothetical protein